MKKTKELEELRAMNRDDLEDKVRGLKKELMNFRFRKASGQLENTGRVSLVRKQVARTYSVIEEKQRASS